MPIALLTDFGTRDYYVGAMKGVVLSINPKARIVDITHEISPQNPREAGFVLAACHRDFPAGTIFLCVVDPGVGSERRAIAAEIEGRIFVSPDNGLLSFIGVSPTAIHQLTEPRFQMSTVSTTFHGRDIFAPAAAYLSLGTPISEFGAPVTDLVRIEQPHATINDREVVGQVIHIDRFGNLVTNIPAETAGEIRALNLNGMLIERVFQTYSQAPDGRAFAICGSAGFIEISVNCGSAAELLTASLGDMVIASLAARPDEN